MPAKNSFSCGATVMALNCETILLKAISGFPHLFLFEVWYFIFFLFDVEKMMESGVDVKWRDESLFRICSKGRHLGGILVDEPLRKAESKHGFPFFDFSLFGISE